MESGLRLQIEKLEAKLKRYRRDNEELRDTNTNSEVIIKIHEMQKELKEQKISDQKNHIEKLSAQIEKLKDENDFNQKLKNQDIKKEINDYEAEIKRLNKIVSDKDEELTQIWHKLENQESVIDQYRQQIKVLQQQNDDSKKTHKLEIAKSNKTLSNNSEEIFRLRNHNKTLVTKIKKLKNSRKTEQSTEDIEGKLLDKQEENDCIRSHNKDLKEQLKKSEDDKKTQVEVIKKFQNDYVQLENKLEKIQNETLKPQGTKIQLPTHINAQKTTLVKENDIVKIPYRHPNHKNRNSKKWEMSKDNDTNMIKAHDERSVGNPNSQ